MRPKWADVVVISLRVRPGWLDVPMTNLLEADSGRSRCCVKIPQALAGT